MLNWIQQFNIFCFLDNHQYQHQPAQFECLAGVGCLHRISVSAGNAFMQLKAFSLQQQDWLFGHFSFDLKCETEGVHTDLPDGVGFPDLHFFVPEYVLKLQANELHIYANDKDAADYVYAMLLASPDQVSQVATNTSVSIQSRMQKAQYLDAVQKLQQHILRGDCYEINYCQEFFAENAQINPLACYNQLVNHSPNPFAVLYRNHDLYCMGASPERYLSLKENELCSQPIKGTAKRVPHNAEEDLASKLTLLNSTKELSENVMVVDLVRNDLSKIGEPGTVRVEELYGIYSFPQVHQMISTVCAQVSKELHWVDAIAATFPMGSMTGAPKKRVLELIEQFEYSKRGLYSGAIGYVTPCINEQRNFDFNVVIRSILYNANTQYLSFHTGSAITFYSNPEQEYEECLLKAEAMKKVLESTND